MQAYFSGRTSEKFFKKMLQIPEYVPKDLVEDLEKIQFQLKILLRNYKVGLVVIYALHARNATYAVFDG